LIGTALRYLRIGYRSEIFNTDQGSQFTSDAFIEALKSNDIQISMDGKLAQYTAHGLIMTPDEFFYDQLPQQNKVA
jgi:hypothetical protein